MATDAVMKATINEIKDLVGAYPGDIAVLVTGQPGIGKSQMFEQIAESRGARYVPCLSAAMDPTDLSGCPHPYKDEFITRFLPPEVYFSLTDHPAVKEELRGPVVVNFDDIAASDQHIFNSLLGFFCDRRVGQDKIRDNVLLCATANDVKHKAGARSLTTALNNRFTHFDLYVSNEEWRYHAYDISVEPSLIAFIEVNPGFLNQFEDALTSGARAFATPRSVVMASRIQKSIGINHDNLLLAMASACGEGWARHYCAFLDNHHLLISPEEILRDPNKAALPPADRMDIVHSTISALVSHLYQKPTVDGCRAGLIYATRIPLVDLGVCLAKDVFTLSHKVEDRNLTAQISCLPEFDEIHEKFGKYFDF